MNTDKSIDISQNVTQCLRAVSDFGGTSYINVCNGAESFVPWGTWDWAGAIILLFIGSVMALMIGVLTLRLIFEL